VDDEPTKRTTSHAKSVEGLYQPENALDRARALKEDFERAARHDTNEKTLPQDRTSETPDTSRYAPRPEPHLRPDGPARRAVDRQIDKKERSKEAQRALELAQDFKQAKQKSPQMNQQKTRHHSR